MARTPNIDGDEREATLWKTYLEAKSQFAMTYEFSSMFYPLERNNDLVSPEIPEQLRSLINRGKQLLHDYELFRVQVRKAYQKAAWEYVEHVVDLHRGDQIQAIGHGGSRVFHCWVAWTDDLNPHDFKVTGPLARKDGSPGAQGCGVANVFSDDWKLIGRARERWPVDEEFGM